MKKQPYPFPGLWGWVATLATVVIADMELAKRGYPTMSRTLGHYLHKPILGPILAGAWAGLAYHLLVEERLIQLDEALVGAKSLADITEPPSQA